MDRGYSTGGRRPELTFSDQEVRDLLAAWAALGLAFALFFAGGGTVLADLRGFALLFVISLLTAGVGFLLHELAHKVVAVRFGQRAAFRANYGMLMVAILAALGGFIFAAPGAVYHQGRVTNRQNGLIAVAGPVTNLLLAVAFLPLVFGPGAIETIGTYGVLINCFLAAFNMLPFGPLDGRKVVGWSLLAFAGTFAVSLVATAVAVVWLFL